MALVASQTHCNSLNCRVKIAIIPWLSYLFSYTVIANVSSSHSGDGATLKFLRFHKCVAEKNEEIKLGCMGIEWAISALME